MAGVAVAHSQLVRLEDSVRRIGRRMPQFPVEEALILRLVALLQRGLSARLDERLAESGLAEVEFRALMVLYSRHDEETTPSDLCAALAQSPAGVTRTVDQLAARGLLTRHADAADRRRQLLQLTAAGEDEVARRLPAMASFVRALFADLPPEGRQGLQSGLRRLCVALETLPTQQSPAERPS